MRIWGRADPRGLIWGPLSDTGRGFGTPKGKVTGVALSPRGEVMLESEQLVVLGAGESRAG